MIHVAIGTGEIEIIGQAISDQWKIETWTLGHSTAPNVTQVRAKEKSLFASYKKIITVMGWYDSAVIEFVTTDSIHISFFEDAKREPVVYGVNLTNVGDESISTWDADKYRISPAVIE